MLTTSSRLYIVALWHITSVSTAETLLGAKRRSLLRLTLSRARAARRRNLASDPLSKCTRLSVLLLNGVNGSLEMLTCRCAMNLQWRCNRRVRRGTRHYRYRSARRARRASNACLAPLGAATGLAREEAEWEEVLLTMRKSVERSQGACIKSVHGIEFDHTMPGRPESLAERLRASISRHSGSGSEH